MKFLSPILFVLFICLYTSPADAQTQKQKGLLWEISGKGLKKPSYVYGTMHVSQKIAFHLGDSFYLALSKSDVVALEQDLDSVIHRWISERDDINASDAGKVMPRFLFEFLSMNDFTLNSYNRYLIKRKLSAEVREVNYLLKRGDQDDFEEDAWLDLYIYQIAKKLGKGFTGVEGYEESRELVKKAGEEPKDAKDKKPKKFNYKLRSQISEAYRRGDIFMLDSIDRLTETDHYLEYMLYKRNANMVRRIDSIIRTGKTMFTGVGCSHLPGAKGVLQMLVEKGYTVRPVQSIALEKSKMAKKYEQMAFSHKYKTYTSDDGLIAATLPTRLTKVNDNSSYSSYLSPDLANGHYYQIEKISSNAVFSGKSPEDILAVIDTLIFENIPGEIQKKNNIASNGLRGIEVVTKLKTGDLNRFQILASPFNIYIIRMAGKKNFATSSDANNFFKSIRINEGEARDWKKISSPDSVFTLEMPTYENNKLEGSSPVNHTFEHLVYEKKSGNSYLVKQLDIINIQYLEQDTIELLVMARSFSKTDNYKIKSLKHFDYEGYHALDAVYTDKNGHELMSRFFICGTRYIMLAKKPGMDPSGFSDRFFTSFHFNGKPAYSFQEYKDTSYFYTVQTPFKPYEVMNSRYSYQFSDDKSEKDSISALFGSKRGMKYFAGQNANELIMVSSGKLGRYSQITPQDEKSIEKEEFGSLKVLNKSEKTHNGVRYLYRTLTDTNTTRRMRYVQVYKGDMMYSIIAVEDTVQGRSRFVDEFISSFRLQDTFIGDPSIKSKSRLFFKDFTSKDSLYRMNAIKHFDNVKFRKEDLPDMFRMIDTIHIHGDAGELRSALLNKLNDIDSAQNLIVPYLQKLYPRFTDTAYMQISIVNALARQKCESAFKVIKPILSEDVPISHEESDMTAMLYALGDSMKLTKWILPELIELTGIPEYRNAAYDLIRRMKDSAIINEMDYASLHNKLVHETKLEYKRVLAATTRFRGNSDDDDYAPSDYVIIDDDISNDDHTDRSMNNLRFPSAPFPYGDYGNSDRRISAETLSDLLDLTLPLRNKNKTIDDIVIKLLKFTDNDVRLDLIPVFLKYNINYPDSVYRTLASEPKTGMRFYDILWRAGQLSKYPSEYKSHQHFIVSDIRSSLYSKQKLANIEFVEQRKMTLQNQTGIVYVYKYKIEDEDAEMLYISNVMNNDTTLLYTQAKPEYSEYEYSYNDNSSLYNQEMPDDQELGTFLDEFFFKKFIISARRSNGAYYYYDYDSYNYESDYDY